MSASNFTIYQLNTKKKWQKIINEFNKDKTEDKKFKIKHNKNKKFKNIIEYKLYVRAASTTPDWERTLSELVEDLDGISNINNSYVLFLRIGKESYVATGGQGYSVLEKDKNFNFGIELLSRLIDKNESVIKRISNRYIAGNIVGGNYQFHEEVSAELEKEFNRYFSEIYAALPSDTIIEKLGIDINTKKESYRLLAKDSIRLSKALTLDELDILLGSISKLLKEKGFSINPVSFVQKKDPIKKSLDNMLTEKLGEYIIDPKIDNGVSIIPYFHVFDRHYIQIDNEDPTIYESEIDIIKYLENMSFDKEASVLLSIVKQVKLIAEMEDTAVESRLYKHLEANIIYNNKTYWLRDGEWLYFEEEFIRDINAKFISNITQEFNQKFMIDGVKSWPDSESETNFNFMHNELPNVYVLDRIFYENIEVCDLLIKEDEHLYFVHVKKGLDRDVRVLVNQIENAMLTLYRGIHTDRQVLEDYYTSIVDKIKNIEENHKKSTLSQSASKFKADFPDSKSFIDLLIKMERKIVFVFAYRPLDSHDLMKPESIQSTIAKLSMLHITKTMKEHDFKLELMKIPEGIEYLADVGELVEVE